MNTLTFDKLALMALGNVDFSLSEEQKERVEKTFTFLQEFSRDKVIYGINTGFGPMAQYKISADELQNLQYNLIRSHAQGVGEVLSAEQTRAVMICRLQTLALGYSGTSPEVIHTLEAYLKAGVYPIIPKHGGVGASGDLVQLAHLGLGLIGEGECHFQGEIVAVEDALKKAGVQPTQLHLRDGLSLINGTSCMSGIAAVNLVHVNNLIEWSISCSSVLNELISSYSDSFSETLNHAKLHAGQQYVAQRMRELTNGGNLKNREDYLFNNKYFDGVQVFKEKVQEYYSLRCVPQIIGPIYDTYLRAREVVELEVNSANDNPIVSVEDQSVYHGGNFHGDYVSLEMDKVRVTTAKLSMLMERQTNYLLNAKLNETYPPFLNSGVLGLNFGLQGMQFTAVSTTAENQTLSNPMYVHSISNNGDNQDVVSMGTNAALLTEKVIDNTYQVLAIQLTCIAQAIDLSEYKENLSANAKDLLSFVRSHMNGGSIDEPRNKQLNSLVGALKATAMEKEL